MCDPVTLAATALSVGKSALEIQSVNATAESQAESVNTQLQQSYTEAEYERQQQVSAAREDGYVAEIQKRQAMGAAKNKGAALGIRGTTANELVSEEAQVGGRNVALAKKRMKNADTAYKLSTDGSYASALAETSAIKAQTPTAFESALTIAAGGLGGYMLGSNINTSLTGVP